MVADRAERVGHFGYENHVNRRDFSPRPVGAGFAVNVFEFESLSRQTWQVEVGSGSAWVHARFQ